MLTLIAQIFRGIDQCTGKPCELPVQRRLEAIYPRKQPGVFASVASAFSNEDAQEEPKRPGDYDELTLVHSIIDKMMPCRKLAIKYVSIKTVGVTGDRVLQIPPVTPVALACIQEQLNLDCHSDIPTDRYRQNFARLRTLLDLVCVTNCLAGLKELAYLGSQEERELLEARMAESIGMKIGDGLKKAGQAIKRETVNPVINSLSRFGQTIKGVFD